MGSKIKKLFGKLLCKTGIFHDYEFWFTKTTEPLKLGVYGSCKREGCFADTKGIATFKTQKDVEVALEYTRIQSLKYL